MYIIVYTLKITPIDGETVTRFVDHWRVAETPEGALKIYNHLIEHEPRLYSATICKPMISTEPQYLGDTLE